MTKFVVGQAISYKDVFGQPCPAIIYDGDSIYALFPCSDGKAKAKLVCALLNSLAEYGGDTHA